MMILLELCLVSLALSVIHSSVHWSTTLKIPKLLFSHSSPQHVCAIYGVRERGVRREKKRWRRQQRMRWFWFSHRTHCIWLEFSSDSNKRSWNCFSLVLCKWVECVWPLFSTFFHSFLAYILRTHQLQMEGKQQLSLCEVKIKRRKSSLSMLEGERRRKKRKMKWQKLSMCWLES